MNYGQILLCDSANGLGIRVTLFVSGCTNHCPGCFQPQTWDFDFGQPFTKETEDFVIEELSKPFYDGITLLGGEPFEEANQVGLLPLLKRIKDNLPNKTIWAYTGFIYDKDLVNGGKRYTPFTDSILSKLDILVDGPFQENNKDISLNFRGSSNQRIIDMPATLKEGHVVLSPLNNQSLLAK